MQAGPAAVPQASTMMLDSEYLRMAQVEAGMWWYTSLHADLLDLIRSHFGTTRSIRILDAGCGTGGLLRYLQAQGYAAGTGLDLAPIAVEFCQRQGLTVQQGSIADPAAMACAGKVDLIVSLDVLCSLPDAAQRAAFFRAAMDQLEEGGLLLVQTPAFPCLGGIHDLAVGVNARYTKRGMQQLLQRAGIGNARLRYRICLLAPLVWVARSLQRLRLRFGRNVAIESDVKLPPPAINRFLFLLQRMEDRWLPFRPFGTSLQILAKKETQA